MGPDHKVKEDGTVVKTSHLPLASLRFIVSPQLPLAAERLDADAGTDERAAKKQKVASTSSNEAAEGKDDDVHRLGATRLSSHSRTSRRRRR